MKNYLLVFFVIANYNSKIISEQNDSVLYQFFYYRHPKKKIIISFENSFELFGSFKAVKMWIFDHCF